MGKAKDEEFLAMLSSAAKGQQNKGLSLIYTEYFESFREYFLKQKADEGTIEDIFQDSVINVYLNIRKPDFILTSSLLTYLIGIGKNIWYKKMRKKKELLGLDGLKNIGTDDDFLGLWTKKEEFGIVKEIMKQLGKSCQSILTMFYLERFRMDEIARRLDYANDQVARNKKLKCMTKLKKIYKENYG